MTHQTASQPSQPSVSDDLPPLRLGQDNGNAEESVSPQLGLAAEMAAAATQTASSVSPTAPSEMSSRPIEEIPTPENAGDVTMGKGASPRPDVINNMMNSPPKATKPEPTPASAPPPPGAEPMVAPDPQLSEPEPETAWSSESEEDEKDYLPPPDPRLKFRFA